MPGVPMVAVFDTAFHQTMPEEGISLRICLMSIMRNTRYRRYGFHGTSHSFVSKQYSKVPWHGSGKFQDHRCTSRQRRIHQCSIERKVCRYLHGSDSAWRDLSWEHVPEILIRLIMEFIAKKENLDIDGYHECTE